MLERTLELKADKKVNLIQSRLEISKFWVVQNYYHKSIWTDIILTLLVNRYLIRSIFRCRVREKFMAYRVFQYLSSNFQKADPEVRVPVQMIY